METALRTHLSQIGLHVPIPNEVAFGALKDNNYIKVNKQY